MSRVQAGRLQRRGHPTSPAAPPMSLAPPAAAPGRAPRRPPRPSRLEPSGGLGASRRGHRVSSESHGARPTGSGVEISVKVRRERARPRGCGPRALPQRSLRTPPPSPRDDSGSGLASRWTLRSAPLCKACVHVRSLHGRPRTMPWTLRCESRYHSASGWYPCIASARRAVSQYVPFWSR